MRMLTAGGLALLAGCGGEPAPYSTLAPAGPAAGSIAWLWWAMFGAGSLVLIAVCVIWLRALCRAPAAEAVERRRQRQWMVGGGLLLPSLSIVLLLAFGIPIGHRLQPGASPDGDALRIDITARQWQWRVRYPDTGIELLDALHIPVGRSVDLYLRTEDVIHAFWVPRLAGKLDMIPGRTNVLRLRADAPGHYQGLCAEYCGVGHAHMPILVEAHAPADFADWLEAQRNAR